MPRTVDFAFNIGEQVTILAIDAPARVDAMTLNNQLGHEYRVVYWIDGERRSDWLYDWEIRGTHPA